MARVNEMNQEALFSFREQVEEDSSRADRWPTVIAHWDGKSASQRWLSNSSAPERMLPIHQQRKGK